MTFGSLFAGIGGFDLGLERAGMVPAWQVEIDPFCRRVLAKHWPNVRRYEDVRIVHGRGACRAGGCDECLDPVDVLCGGFPCQDISVAGRGAGIDGDRSGLWSEFHRIIREVRPRIVFVENVSALLTRGMGRVLGDLASSGYDAEWECLPASAFGAPHRRDRVWIVADADGDHGFGRCGILQVGRESITCEAERNTVADGAQWRVESAVGRVAYGVPGRVDRLRGLGNAVVPQIVEWIGRRILAADP